MHICHACLHRSTLTKDIDEPCACALSKFFPCMVCTCITCATCMHMELSKFFPLQILPPYLLCTMSMSCTSTIGTTLPVAAAPTAAAPIHASLIGVSMTR